MVSSAPLVDFTTAHEKVRALCDHFEAQRAHVMAASYKEAEARDEFSTPFFEAFGWDVRNTAHRSVYEKDVVIESRQNISGTAKSADYAFRRPGTHLTSFFVEAKKPSVDIRGHAECHQAVLYGWNASTPLVVLTDFDQFLILDARSEPDRTNAARHVLEANGSYTWQDYRDLEKFAELWGLLARENVAAGSLDKAAAALPRLSGRVKKDDRDRFVADNPRRGFVPVIDGTNIGRYTLRPSTEFVDFRAVAIKSGGKKHVYEQERVGVRQIGASPIFTVLPAALYSLNTIYNIYFPEPTPYSIHYVQGIVASKFNRWHWLANNFDQKKTFPKIKKDALLSIPIPSIDFSNPQDASRHALVVSIVGKLIAAKSSEASAQDPVKHAHWTRQCIALDRQLDSLVYELYGLSDAEIALVEKR